MRIPLKAWYFRSTVDEKKVREKFSDFIFECDDPLILRSSGGSRVLITSFGAVVFWPFEENTARLVATRIQETLADPFLAEEVEDRLAVETQKGEERILFNEVWLSSEPTSAQLHIIALLLAQSVALDYLETEAVAAMESFSVYLKDLKENGHIGISTRTILQHIGFAMQTRYAVMSNLALFDKPPETWESESLEKLYRGLHDFFDLPERELSLTTKLNFLAENTSLLLDFISSRKSLRLDWAIVILIALEIFGFVIYEMIH